MSESRRFTGLMMTGMLLLSACGTKETTSIQTPAVQVAPLAVPTAVVEAAIPAEAGPAQPATTESAAASPLDAFSAPVTAQGELLVLAGQVLDSDGSPLAGAAVEIWQTDTQGIYDHPGDPDTGRRDSGFQFYGTSITTSDGSYSFRTIVPGEYEPRPRHIHVKVRVDGREVLTTQFYFSEDGAGGGVGGSNENLLLTTETVTGADGAVVRLGYFDLVVNTGGGQGTLRLTDSQGEGPYYPVISVADYDNDLASIE